MKPDWKDAPEWANYCARDEDGEWFWYADKPEIGPGMWQTEGTLQRINYRDGDWMETLEERSR